MRVVSKLAQIDFAFGEIGRDGNLLVIESHPESRMSSTVYVSPGDVVAALKRILVSPGAVLFLLGLPWFLYRWNRAGGDAARRRRVRKEWPSV